MAGGVDIGTAWINVVPSFRGIKKNVGKEFGSMGDTAGHSMSKGMRGAFSQGGGVGRLLGDSLNAATGIAAAGAAAIGAVITTNLGGAIARADTLNAFPKILSGMGYGADEARAAITRMADSLDGLPGTTDQLASAMQGILPGVGNVERATDITIALNDALLAGGASAADASRATIQYSQMVAKGSVDMQSFRTLQETMPGPLGKVAEALLGAGTSSTQLYEAMKNGTVSFDEFNDQLIEFDRNGGDGFVSFAEQAKTASAGIGTSFDLIGTRIRKAMEKVISAIGVDAIAGKIDEFTQGIGKMGDGIADFVTNAKESGDALNPFKGALDGAGTAVGGLLGSFGPLLARLPIINGLFVGITGPVGMVIGAFVDMIRNSEALREAFGNAFDKIGGVVQSVMPTVMDAVGAFGRIMGTLGDIFAPIIELIGSMFAKLIEVVVPALGQLLAACEPFISALRDVLGPVIEALVPVVQTAWDAIVDAVGVAIDVVTGLIDAGTALLQGDWSGAWDLILQAVGLAWDGIVALVKGGVDAILQLFGTDLDTVSEQWDTVFSTLKTGWESFVAGLQTVWDAVGQPFVDFLGTVWNVVTAAWDIVFTVLKAVFNIFAGTLLAIWNTVGQPLINLLLTVWDGIKAAWDVVFSGLKTGWDLLVAGLKIAWDILGQPLVDALLVVWDVIAAAWDATFSVLKAGWDFFISGLKAVWDAVGQPLVDFLGAAWDGVKTTWTNLWDGIASFFSNIWTGIQTTADDGVQGVADRVTGVKDTIVGFFSDAGSWLVDSGRAVIQGLIDGISGMTQMATNAVGDVLGAARNFLPFSPAKEGPFSGKGWTLYSGRSIVEALAQGVGERQGLFAGAVKATMDAGSSELGALSAGVSVRSHMTPMNFDHTRNERGDRDSKWNVTINESDNPDATMRYLGRELEKLGV